jgi:NTE family protein
MDQLKIRDAQKVQSERVLNAAIIVGSKNDSEPEAQLEDFWLNVAEKITPSVLPDGLRCMVSSTHAAMYGNLKTFMPLWFMLPNPNENYFSYYRSPYLYSMTPLKKTLLKYIDFAKLSNSDTRPRLIITSTDIQKRESVTFDSKFMSVDTEEENSCNRVG